MTDHGTILDILFHVGFWSGIAGISLHAIGLVFGVFMTAWDIGRAIVLAVRRNRDLYHKTLSEAASTVGEPTDE